MASDFKVDRSPKKNPTINNMNIRDYSAFSLITKQI